MAVLTPILNPVMQFLDDNGAPLTGAKLYTYRAGAGQTAEKLTYQDASALETHSNPIVLNSRGETAIADGTAKGVFGENLSTYDGGSTYKLALYPATSTEDGYGYPQGDAIWTVDGVNLTPMGTWVTENLLEDTSASAVRTTLGLGTAAVEDVGTGAGNVVQLDGSQRIPAVDGSLLTNIVHPSTAPRSYLAGLGLSKSAATTIGIARGVARDNDDAGGSAEDMELTSAYTKTMASWAVGTGNGGLDGGAAAADTWYYVFLIKRTDTDVVDVLISNSATSPTMPTDYDKSRRIGAFLTDGTPEILAFTQNGDEFLFDVVMVDSTAATVGQADQTITLTKIPALDIEALLTVKAVHGVWVRPKSVTTGTVDDPEDTHTNMQVNVYQNDATHAASLDMRLRTNSSKEIIARSYTDGGNSSVYCYTRGWIDRRGRDD